MSTRLFSSAPASHHAVPGRASQSCPLMYLLRPDLHPRRSVFASVTSELKPLLPCPALREFVDKVRMESTSMSVSLPGTAVLQ
jgi:hypothetical protein